MQFTTKKIAKILHIDNHGLKHDYHVEHVTVDSRRISIPATTIFVALPGKMSHGSSFISDAYNKGVRSFLADKKPENPIYSDADFIVVSDPLEAMQRLAKIFLQSLPAKKIAITGSNGKTIIKEWLYQMLYDLQNIAKSPKSYNSQIGVPLSIFTIKPNVDLAILEVGISKIGEMKNHLDIIAPDIGLITNIGSAHDAGFDSRAEKLNEKIQLFQTCETIIYCADHEAIHNAIQEKYSSKKLFSWGTGSAARIKINFVEQKESLQIQLEDESVTLPCRFTDDASIENLSHCIATLIYLDVPLSSVVELAKRIDPLPMRLEMTAGIENTIIINDAYSADLHSLDVALSFLKKQSGQRKKMAILSAFDQSGMTEEDTIFKIQQTLINNGINQLIYFSKNKPSKEIEGIKVFHYYSKGEFFDEMSNLDLANHVILVKGARRYHMEEVVQKLSYQSHSAYLSINLAALENNIRVYKSYLKEGVRVMAVIKASAYGSGASEVAHVLANSNIDYLAVAFADEGISLRKADISLPILVLNPDISVLPDIIQYNLEIEVYAMDQLEKIIAYTNQLNKPINIHLKLDTGMHRLGFSEEEIKDLIKAVATNSFLKVKSVFSHLSSSEDESHDQYSNTQFRKFDRMYDQLKEGLSNSPLRHILNSAGISRFPNRQYDMVRLGIGLYGLDNNKNISQQLQKVHGLFAQIIQVKNLKAGESVGYNRSTILKRDTLVGIVNIGYADGLMRNVGNEKYGLLVGNDIAPIIGRVCMDLTIIDLTDIPNASVGDEVVLFDEKHTINKLASAANTIPYEILSRISERVKRKFLE